MNQKKSPQDFPGGQCLRLQTSTEGGLGSTPIQGTKIPQCGQKISQHKITLIYSKNVSTGEKT